MKLGGTLALSNARKLDTFNGASLIPMKTMHCRSRDLVLGRTEHSK